LRERRGERGKRRHQDPSSRRREANIEGRRKRRDEARGRRGTRLEERK